MSTLAATLPMPYAPPAGWGPSATAAALLPALLAPGAGATHRVLGETVTVKVTAAQTGGAYSLFELVCPPGSGTPPHREREDEVFVVLEGELTFMLDWETRAAGPGACAFVPRGTPHCYQNRSDRPARALVLCAPGGPKEAMFAALDAWGRISGPGGGPPDVNVVGAICAAHGVELLAPR